MWGVCTQGTTATAKIMKHGKQVYNTSYAYTYIMENVNLLSKQLGDEYKGVQDVSAVEEYSYIILF